MFNKITTTILALLIIVGMNAPWMASVANAATPKLEYLFRPFNYTSGADNNNTSKIGIVSNIAKNSQGTWTDILGNVIKFILSITGALAFVSFSVAGVMMVTARGNEEQIKKGKEILLWSLIALAIIATSYAIVLGVSQLKFGA